jgi:hypothetical protein
VNKNRPDQYDPDDYLFLDSPVKPANDTGQSGE